MGGLGEVLGGLGALLGPLGLTWGGPGGVLERSWPPKKTLKSKAKNNSETITYNLCVRVDFWSFLDALLVPRNRCVPGGFAAKNACVLDSRVHLCACAHLCVRVDFWPFWDVLLIPEIGACRGDSLQQMYAFWIREQKKPPKPLRAKAQAIFWIFLCAALCHFGPLARCFK